MTKEQLKGIKEEIEKFRMNLEKKESYLKQTGIPTKNVLTADEINNIGNKFDGLIEYIADLYDNFPTEEQITTIIEKSETNFGNKIKEFIDKYEKLEKELDDIKTKGLGTKIVELEMSYDIIEMLESGNYLRKWIEVSFPSGDLSELLIAKTNNFEITYDYKEKMIGYINTDVVNTTVNGEFIKLNAFIESTENINLVETLKQKGSVEGFNYNPNNLKDGDDIPKINYYKKLFNKTGFSSANFKFCFQIIGSKE